MNQALALRHLDFFLRHSICSDTDMTDLPSGGTVHFSGTPVGYLYGSLSNEAEVAWRQYLNALVSDSYGTLVPQSFLLFARTFKDLRHRSISITQDCCHILAIVDGPRAVISQFHNMVDVLGGVDCPQVYVDFEAISACHLVEKLRYCVLELQEHLDTYAEKKDHTIDVRT